MILEGISALVILGIAILFLNPGNLSMPMGVVSMMTLAIIISFLFFAALILKEKASDERESLHILSAGRISYIIGVGTLVIAIIIQGINHDIDPWLVIVLCVMVFTKLLYRIYSNIKK